MTASIITLGCKVNEYESESMATQLKNAGYLVFEGLKFADLYILNTCAVTNIAEKKSRQFISKILKINPKARIAVCGCASQNNKMQFASDNIISVFGNAGKNNIVETINKNFFGLNDFANEYETCLYASNVRARQFIKIQDGCDYFCTYCIIPYLRGRSHSRPINDILKEIKNSKAQEIILTGINMSDYKIDGKIALKNLVQEVDKINRRFRISSLEVNVLTDELIEVFKNLKNFCQHFHISLQSACNETLKRMNRRYTIEQYTEVLNKLKTVMPECCISTDIIVGFKGETTEEFNTTLNNIKNMPLDFMHIFPYSVRKGTVAEKLGGSVDKAEITKRAKILGEHNKIIQKKFYEKNLNSNHNVLIECIDEDYACGYTENYIYTYLKKGDRKVGETVNVVLLSIYKDGMLAKVC